VLIDPSHGGEDKGAVFTSKLLEKDVTLSLARELRKELTQRGIPAKMLRDGDVNMGLDRRAEIANEPHTALYIALHAGRPGRGVRVYAPMLTSPQPPTGRFLAWDSAQAQSLERSRKLAQAVAKELKRKEMQVTVLGVSLRPLSNVVPPAIAVEMAPDPNNAHSLESEKMQNTVASAIAAAIAQTRGLAGGHP
jgi:N-acetylmuramoyl-L-alanine amidase